MGGKGVLIWRDGERGTVGGGGGRSGPFNEEKHEKSLLKIFVLSIGKSILCILVDERPRKVVLFSRNRFLQEN